MIIRAARHACDAGSTLKDVTEAVGLVSNERTLVCACLADRLLVQVMHKRMQLCSMDAVLSPDQGEPPAPCCLCVSRPPSSPDALMHAVLPPVSTPLSYFPLHFCFPLPPLTNHPSLWRLAVR